MRKVGQVLDHHARPSNMITSHTDHVQSVTASYAPVYQLLRRAVKQYLDKCGRGYVDLGKLFSFALKKQPVGAQSMLAAR